MRTIYKYPLHNTGANTIMVPFGGIIRKVGEQFGTVTLWIEVHSDNSREERHFVIYGTGHDIPAGTEYVGTAFCDPFVWHVYEYQAPPKVDG